MAKGTKIKEVARHLREKGWSLKEISAYLTIAKSTASAWVQDVPVGREGKERLKALCTQGRENALKHKQQTVEAKERDAFQWAETVCQSLSLTKEQAQMYCALLYWGEGGKTIHHRVEFTNSDPKMIRVFLSLFREGFSIDEKKLRVTMHLHDYHDEKAQLQFWADITHISPSQFHKVHRKKILGKRRRADYQGCVRISYYHSQTARRIKALYLTLARHT